MLCLKRKKRPTNEEQQKSNNEESGENDLQTTPKTTRANHDISVWSARVFYKSSMNFH